MRQLFETYKILARHRVTPKKIRILFLSTYNMHHNAGKCVSVCGMCGVCVCVCVLCVQPSTDSCMMLVNEEVHVRTISEKFINNTWIVDGGEVTKVFFILGNLPQNTAHDLTRACFGQSRGTLDNVWCGERTNLQANCRKVKELSLVM